MLTRVASDGLLLGGPRLGADNRAHNSAYLLGAGGGIVGSYDKRHLVPGFVSPTGAVYATIPRDTAGVSVAAVEPLQGLTPYTRWGDLWILGAAIAPAAGLGRWKRGRRV